MARYFKRIRQKVKSLRGHAETPESASEASSSHPVLETEAAPLTSTESSTQDDASPLPDGNPGTKDAEVTLLFPARDRQDLWREAFFKLDDAERALLGFAVASGGNGAGGTSDGASESGRDDMASAIQKILGAANTLKKADEEKQYATVSAPNSRLIVVSIGTHLEQSRDSTRSLTALQK
jgi:hypothetical protein